MLNRRFNKYGRGMIKILKYVEFMGFAIATTVWWFIFYILMSLICTWVRILGKEGPDITKELIDPFPRKGFKQLIKKNRS